MTDATPTLPPTPPKRYKPNDGWFSAKLPLEVDAKLREMAVGTRRTLTAVVCLAVEREYGVWKEGGK